MSTLYIMVHVWVVSREIYVMAHKITDKVMLQRLELLPIQSLGNNYAHIMLHWNANKFVLGIIEGSRTRVD